MVEYGDEFWVGVVKYGGKLGLFLGGVWCVCVWGVWMCVLWGFCCIWVLLVGICGCLFVVGLWGSDDEVCVWGLCVVGFGVGVYWMCVGDWYWFGFFYCVFCWVGWWSGECGYLCWFYCCSCYLIGGCGSW